MKRLIFDMERFSEGSYSKLFNDVITSLMHNGIIMSPEASEAVYKALYDQGSLSGLNHAINVYNQDEDMPIVKWEQLKKEL